MVPASVGASVSQSSSLVFMSDAGSMSSSDARSRELLHRIASAVGVPLEAIQHGGLLEIEARETCELLRIWRGLDVPADRQKLLAFARTLSSSRNTV